MKIAQFRNHTIQRTCKRHFDNPQQYKDDLSRDFQQRCGYCNMLENIIDPLPFQVDHFVPKKTFEGIRDDLYSNYSNLIWSCPKCNNAKRAKFEGTITPDFADNTLFYKPDTTDYNLYFYRNEYGGIMSNDAKGIEMIKLLKLHRKSYNYSWIIELINNCISTLDKIMDTANGTDKIKLQNLLLRLYKKRDYFKELLCIAYRNNV